MVGSVAQLCSSALFPSITRIVYILIPVALILAQTSLVRASICEALVVQRFWVFRPSVRKTMYLSIPDEGAVPSVSGSLEVSACQPQTKPMVRLVLPYAFIWSTLALSAVQSDVS